MNTLNSLKIAQKNFLNNFNASHDIFEDHIKINDKTTSLWLLHRDSFWIVNNESDSIHFVRFSKLLSQKDDSNFIAYSKDKKEILIKSTTFQEECFVPDINLYVLSVENQMKDVSEINKACFDKIISYAKSETDYNIRFRTFKESDQAELSDTPEEKSIKIDLRKNELTRQNTSSRTVKRIGIENRIKKEDLNLKNKSKLDDFDIQKAKLPF